MNKRKITALIMVSMMLCSSMLTACGQANSSLSSNDEQNRPSADRDLVNDPPKTGTATGNTGYAEADGKATDLFAGYRKEAIFASLGIQADDYVDVIVSLKGDTLLDKYLSSKSTLSVAEYTAEKGNSYKDSLLLQHKIVQQEILGRVDASAEFSYSYTLADNGFAAKVKYKDISKIRALASVDEVRLAEVYNVPDEMTTLYYASQDASAVDTASETDPKAGAGVFLAVIDSALDAESDSINETNGELHGHPAFRGDWGNIDMDTAAVNKTIISTVMKSTSAYYYDFYYNYSTKDYDPPVESYYYNNKVVFAFDYGNMDSHVMAYSYFGEQLDHGTHSAGIAVGYDPENEFCGTAPAAQLAFMKVAHENLADGTVSMSDLDIALAIEDCIILGVDAINLSLGAPRGFSADNRAENYIWQYCEYADQVGINVQAAVGNNFSGAYDGVNGDYPLAGHPDYSALNSPGSYDSTLAVGSFDGTNVKQEYALVGEGEGAFKVAITEPTKTALLQSEEKNYKSIETGEYQWVYVDGEGSYNDFVKAGARNKLAVVTMREIPANLNYIMQEVYLRDYASDQMANAKRAGAIGILYADRNYQLVRMIAVDMLDSQAIPFCAISRVDADRMKQLQSGKITFNSAKQIAYNLMSVFSSWGPTNTLQIKPEIVGLGGSVYSSLLYKADYGDRAPNYGVYSGTSMAAPQVTAYVAMLKHKLKQENHGLTSQELSKLTNSILMSTATPLVNTLSDDEDNIYSPRYQGAGAVNYEAATKTEAYLTVTGSDKPKIELGEDEKKTGVYLLNFNIHNTTNSELSYEIDADVLTDSLLPDGKTVSFLSHAFTDYTMKVKTYGGQYNGTTHTVTVPAKQTVSVAVTIKLSEADKTYLDKNFAYGSYVEGYVRLNGKNDITNLSVPFLAFYGDWEKSALMDATVYDNEEAYLYASSLIASYYGGFFKAYLGEYQYEVPENFGYITEENGQFVKGDVITFEDIRYDALRLAIGSRTGGFNALSAIYLGLLRNADRVEYLITNAATGELYEAYTVSQLGRASYLESYGGMYPVIQGLSYGSDLPNNARIKLSIRASFSNMNGTINVKDQTDFYITIDSETPRLYSDSKGLIKQGDRTYLSINVYDNYTLAAVGIYGVDAETGVSAALSAPFPVNTSTWKAGEKNTLVFDVTELIAGFKGEIGVTLEDSAMNAVNYRVASTISTGSSGGDETVGPATSITFNTEMNLAVDYSTDLGIVTVPANASYKISVDRQKEVEADSQKEYTYNGAAYIDESGDKPLVVATKAGYVRVKIESGTITQYSDIYIYIVDGEWIIVLNDTWVSRDEWPNPDASRTYWVYAYNGEGSHVTIPSTYTEDGEEAGDIVYIGGNAFYGDTTLQSVTIPNTVVRIGWSAFERTYNLRTVNFEAGSHLKSIDSMAFENARSLKHIKFPASLEIIDGRAFYHAQSLKTIEFEENSRLKALRYSVFSDTVLEEVRLPDGVEAIGDAFSDIPTLKKIELPESLTSLGQGAFEYSAITEIYIPTNVTSIPANTFAGCTQLRKVELPDGITSIGGGAFANCLSLTSFTVPASTTKIDSSAFANCARLLSVRLGDALNEVANTAFVGCTSLRTVYFDKETSLANIGTDVFYGCYSLEEFTVHPQNSKFMADDGILYRAVPGEGEHYELFCVPSNKTVESILIRPDVAQIRDYAFAYHTELKTVLFSSGGALSKIGNYAFAACTSLSTINLESATNLSSLGDYALAHCRSLKSIAFPRSLTEISSYAFYADTYLENIQLHKDIQRIGSFAFAGCIRFAGTDGKGTLVMPSRVNWLGTGAFLVNRSLTKVDMGGCTAFTGESTNNGESAFESCYNLREVILPETMTYMWGYMFADCTALEKINLGATKVTTIRNHAFYGCDSLKEIELPQTLEILHSYAFAFSGLTHIVLPESISIGAPAGQLWSYAFAGCTSLESVEFPSSLTSIPTFAFAETALREVKLPKSLTLGGFASTAFYLCSALEKFEVEEGNLAFATTKEGILYLPATSDHDATLVLCPSNLQAETLTFDPMFKTIPSSFFQLTTGIDTVIIPATITVVEAGAFYYSGVRQVIFDEDSDVLFGGYTHVGVFNGCTNLERIVLPRHITNIPYSMFANCENLVSIELPETVTDIYPMAFYNCRKLVNINLTNVQSIDESAFGYCESLREVRLGKDLYKVCFALNATAFEGCRSLEAVYVDEANLFYKDIDGVLFDKVGSVLYLYPAAKQGTEYKVPEGVSKINELAFGFNKNLTRVVLPQSLKVVGTFAFYKTEKLLDYYFLGTTAPTLEGQYMNGVGSLYANFYDFYAVDFGEMYLALHYPAAGKGYDNWLYQSFFYTFDAFTNSGFNSPSQGDITRPNEGNNSGEGEEFGDRLRKRIKELKERASNALKEKLDALFARFEAESSFLAEELWEADAFTAFEDAYIREAESIAEVESELFAYMWARIYEIIDLVNARKLTEEFSPENADALDTIAYSAWYVIIRSSTFAQIDYYYEYYLSYVEGLPSLDETEAFQQEKKQALAQVDSMYEEFMTHKEDYDKDVLDYTTEAYERIYSNVGGARSSGQIKSGLAELQALLKEVPSKATRDAFEAKRAEQLARFDKYKEEDYDYALWSQYAIQMSTGEIVGICDYLKIMRESVMEIFLLSEIQEAVDAACALIDGMKSKLYYARQQKLNLLDYFIAQYNMYSYLFDDEALVLREIEAELRAEMDAAESIAQLQEAYESGTARMWSYFEYHQKAYTEYRRALSAFELLDSATRAAAMQELESLSFRVTENWRAIRALIEKYTGVAE